MSHGQPGPACQARVESLIQEMAQQDAGLALIFASHNLGQVKRLATRVVYLEQGQVLADLPVQTFFGGTVLQQRTRRQRWIIFEERRYETS